MFIKIENDVLRIDYVNQVHIMENILFIEMKYGSRQIQGPIDFLEKQISDFVYFLNNPGRKENSVFEFKNYI